MTSSGRSHVDAGEPVRPGGGLRHTQFRQRAAKARSGQARKLAALKQCGPNVLRLSRSKAHC
jgi:hypothetical protein